MEKTVNKKEKEKFKSKLKKEENEGKREIWKSLPYIKGITDKIGRRLGKFGIRTAFKTNRTIKSLVFNAKQRSGKMEQEGIYKMDCGKNNIRITERKISQRISEHKRSIKCCDLNNAIVSTLEQNVMKRFYGRS